MGGSRMNGQPKRGGLLVPVSLSVAARLKTQLTRTGGYTLAEFVERLLVHQLAALESGADSHHDPRLWRPDQDGQL
jgi:hypothetical protein